MYNESRSLKLKTTRETTSVQSPVCDLFLWEHPKTPVNVSTSREVYIQKK